MSRDGLSADLLAAIAAPCRQPAYLFDLFLSAGVYRGSSGGDLQWNGNWYVATDIRSCDIKFDGRGNPSGRLVVGNLDAVFGAVIYNDDNPDWPITVYKFDRAAVGTPDIRKIFTGSASTPTGLDEISLDLVTYGLKTARSPRTVISPAEGYNWLTAPGTRLQTPSGAYVFNPRN